MKREHYPGVWRFVFWCAIGVLYLSLSLFHFFQIGQHIEKIEASIEIRGLQSGGDDVFGTIDNALVSMDDRIDRLNRNSDRTNHVAGWSYVVAATAAFV